MPRSPAPTRARRKAPDKAPAARAAAPGRKASTSRAVTVAPPVAEVSEGAPPAASARRAKAPAPVAGKRQAPARAAKATGKTAPKPAPRKKPVASVAKPPVKSVAPRGDAQAVTAAAPAPRRARRRESTAEVLDALDQGFVPKAPPPTAPANARSTEPAAHEPPGTNAETSHAGLRLGASAEVTHSGIRLGTSVHTRLPALEPVPQPRPDAPAATAAAPNQPLAAATARLRCPGCDYPLARQARFCRRCGVAQRQSGMLPLLGEQRTPASAVATLLPPGVPEPAAESRPTYIDSESRHAEVDPQNFDDGSKKLDAESPKIDDDSPGVEIESLQRVIASPAPEAEGLLLPCVACAMPLPGIARFCMFCAAPQAVERAQAPHPSLPDDCHVPVEATVDREGHPGDSPVPADPVTQSASPPVDAASSETALPLDAASPETALSMDAAPSETAPPSDAVVSEATPDADSARETMATDAPPSDIPQVDRPSTEPALQQPAEAFEPPATAEPAPTATVTLLEPDVVERLAKARHDIDEIGRSIDGLTRTLTAGSATGRRPSALPPRRR